MGTLKIKNLLLRTCVGFNPHEIGKRQDVNINITIEYDSSKEEMTDLPADALDYRALTKTIIARVEEGRFNLIETLGRMVLDNVMANDRVLRAEVEIDKLHALRFSESVSFTIAESR